MKFRPAYLLLMGFVLSGCGGKPSTPEIIEAQPMPAQTSQKMVVDSTQAAALKGKVFFEGETPTLPKIPIRGNPECAVFHKDGEVPSEEILVQNGALQNVFVYVKEGLEGQNFQTPAQAVTIENKNCVYVPHVVGVQVGQPVVLFNDDPTLHNVHSYSKNSKMWNLGLPFQGMKQTKRFEAPEVMVTLKCDVHPWMVGYVGVLTHPYFAVTDASGNFEIKNLPAGEYLLEAWHEKLGIQSQKIKVQPEEIKEINFTFAL